MYLIALCDDEAAELDKTEQMLRKYEKTHTVEFLTQRFENAEDLLYQVKETGYEPDFILMDIYLPEKMGIQAAKELRDMGSGGKIIFLTTSKEHALEAFGVDAAQYLVKPVSDAVLFPVLDRLLEHAEDMRKRYLLLRVDGKIKRIAVDHIAYCEAQGKRQYLHFVDGGQCLLRITMTEIYEMLSRYEEFVRVGIAYIVNLGHVDSFNARELQMDDGRRIYLPRGAYQPLRERYFAYYCGEEKELNI
ncbi:MAG: LytTR family DNA-binding domain-containing protein [Candidatus Gastranaerophilales bacterium]|nr:LytTR family DNA-binding domain-containing protein [Candidatus Gastranaerophilales bacterium]